RRRRRCSRNTFRYRLAFNALGLCRRLAEDKAGVENRVRWVVWRKYGSRRGLAVGRSESREDPCSRVPWRPPGPGMGIFAAGSVPDFTDCRWPRRGSARVELGGVPKTDLRKAIDSCP